MTDDPAKESIILDESRSITFGKDKNDNSPHNHFDCPSIRTGNRRLVFGRRSNPTADAGQSST
jgi:hypothetical protein